MLYRRAGAKLNGIFTTLLFVVVLCYFTYHAIIGKRGLISLIQLTKQIEVAKVEFDLIHAKRKKLERNVRLMRDDSLDLDLLDEQARRYLSYAAHGEKVYNLN